MRKSLKVLLTLSVMLAVANGSFAQEENKIARSVKETAAKQQSIMPKSVIPVSMKHYYDEFFNPSSAPVPVKFGTSGHRGELGAGFCALHAKAVAQAVARMHKEQNITGPILVGGDTRLMSRDTANICAQVLAANGFEVILPDIPVPTPVFSFEILEGRASASLNGTASHNPPEDMGLKYNSDNGGPAGKDVTSLIEKYANEYMKDPSQIKMMPLEEAYQKGLVRNADVVTPYVQALGKKIDFAAIAASDQRFALHPMGGTGLPYYRMIKEMYNLQNVDIVSTEIDPTFSFIPADNTGKIRMDPSSRYAMVELIDYVNQGIYQFAGASDPDADRFGAATEKGGLLIPNHALPVMADYLIRHHKVPGAVAIGRTISTTGLLDRIAEANGLQLDEVNVGFKYFVDGLYNNRYVLAGEESAGMSSGNWTTEKDGIYAVFLLMEITAKEGDIATLYKQVAAKYGGEPIYGRLDLRVDPQVKARVKAMKKDWYDLVLMDIK
ncbi:MAG: hypothetical protein MJ053_05590, partial [Elusimicrobiaceae bacterium]|nr:hypothetical protein [Elusimicrobiaceae bacterium]